MIRTAPLPILCLAIALTGLISACKQASSDSDSVAASSAASMAADEDSVRAVVARFGQRLQSVSLLGPDSSVAADLRAQYTQLVTPELLALWLEEPSSAPGRRVSSPWPDRIEVERVKRTSADEFEVTGRVVYVSSAGAEGEGKSSGAVRLRLMQGTDGHWRISDYSEGAA